MVPQFLKNVTPSGTFTALPDIVCRTVTVLNNSGDALSIRYAGTSDPDFIVLATGQPVTLNVPLNANQLEIKGSGSDAAKVSLICE